MQYLEDDMDDLFRKAADQYPLHTDAKDWDGLAAGLANSRNSKKSNTKFNLKYIPATILILLVLTGTGLMVNYFHKAPNASKSINIANALEAATKPLRITHIHLNKAIAAGNIAPSGSSHTKNFLKKHEFNANSDLFENKNGSYDKTEQSNQYRQLQIDPLSGLEENIQPMPFALNNLNAFETGFTSNIKILPNLKMASGKLSPNQQSKDKALSKIKSFYVDLIGGIQMNQVAGQGFSKPGFVLGINGGYRFNRSVAAELGILYSNKHYFSDGQYFDIGKAGASMPANMKIINLQGSSQLIEIPIGLRYNFPHTKYKLFITSGVSSFIITREQNNYLAIINGVEQNMNGMYQHKRAYLASAINFSMGNEFTIGKKQTRLRIEPFLQVPVKGMGVGLMSVTGAGIRIGIGLPHH